MAVSVGDLATELASIDDDRAKLAGVHMGVREVDKDHLAGLKPRLAPDQGGR